ncbi:MAG TPA: RecX family transcriptional regulator [Vicinamibacterales bacterium]
MRVPSAPPDPSPAAARVLALRWLAARELTAAQVRLRLRRRQFPPEAIDEAIAGLQADGLLDDRRAAEARARHETTIRRRGRHRVLRQLQAIGVDPETAERAVAGVFADVDEDRQIADAIARRLRGSPIPADPRDRARLARWLLAQGFDGDRIRRALEKHGRPGR